MAVTLLNLRQSLATALTAYLGTYTLGNGETTEAICVQASGERRQAGITVSGLEAIIGRDPAQRVLSGYKAPGVEDVWTVYLVSWDDNTTNLTDAAAAIAALFPKTTISEINVPQGEEPRHQKRVDIAIDPVTAAP